MKKNLKVPTINEIFQYNLKFNKKIKNIDLLSKILNHNKADIFSSIREYIRTDEEIPAKFVTEKVIRKNIRKNNKKITVKTSFNKGNIYTLGANLDEEGTDIIFSLPLEDEKESELSKIEFKYENTRMNKMKFDQLEVMLRSEKIPLNIIKKEYKKFSEISLETMFAINNEKFLNLLKLWSKH